MTAGSHIEFDLGNIRLPTKCIVGLSLVLKFGLVCFIEACRGYEILHPYPYPCTRIFRGYPWIYPYPQVPILRTQYPPNIRKARMVSIHSVQY